MAQHGSSSGRWRGVALVLAGLGLGAGLTVGLPALADAWAERDGSTGSPLPPLSTDGVEEALQEGNGAAAGDRRRSDTPGAAVEAFLAAERDRDYAGSFAWLSDPARSTYGSAPGWVASHADELPVVTGFTVGEAPVEASGRVRVESDVQFEPGLDPVVGLTPGRARVTWTAVEEAGGWAVEMDSAELVPVLPDPSGAATAARSWVDARRSCPEEGQPVPGENADGVRGELRHAAALCGATGPTEVGAPAPLDVLDAQPFLTAYGEGAAQWAQVVPVTAPVPQRLVLAPLDEAWQVVGVLGPKAG